MRLFVFILLAALAFTASPTRAQSGTDPGGLFVDAYMAVQQGEKAEQSGNFKLALSKLRSAATVLDQIVTRFPNWQTQIVDYRKTRTAEGIVRVQEKIARFGAGKTDGGEGLPSADPLSLPQGGSEKLNLGENPIAPAEPPSGSPPSRNPRHPAPRDGDSELFAQAEQRMKKLEADLTAARNEAAHLQDEKAKIAKQLEEAAKARTDADQKQQVLQKRADNAEQALLKATADGKTDAEKIKTLQADAASTKRAVRDMRIEADADTEYRQQLDDRFKVAMTRIQQLTLDRDAARSASSSVPGKIEGIQKQLEQVKKEKDDLAAKLQKTETQLSKMTGERDDALAQVAKLQDAQKQMDKLVADNTALMAKLSDAQKTITQFKIEGDEKDKQIASLKTEVTSVKEQLAQARKDSAEYQRQMADLQSKLEESGKQLADARAENTASTADKKKMVQEIGILRGIVLRQQKEEAVRAETRKAVLGELSGLEIHSKSLVKQIEFLSEPVVRLTEKERALFKKPELQVGDTEISIGGPAAGGASGASGPDTVPSPLASAPKQTESPSPAVAVNPVPAPPPTVNPVPPPPVEIAPTPVPPSKGKSADAGKTADNGKKAATPKSPEKSKTVDQPPLPAVENPPSLSLSQQPPTPASIAPGPLADPASPKVGPLASMKNATTPTPAPSTDPTAGAAGSSAGATTASRSSSVPDLPPELLSLARDGKDQFERGNYLEAEKIYRKILAKSPNSLYTLSNLGVVLFRAKKHKLAEEMFKKAIAVAPEDGFSHCTLGIVYYDQGKYDESVNELTKALAINSKDATAHNYLGITASQKGWQEAALKELETATALEPNYADAWFNLAVVYAVQTPPNKEMARKCYQRATELGAERDVSLEQLIK